MELVSIIIPIYNVSKYLDSCVASACAQTYTELEIILVDDGSPDDCPAKCDAWVKKDSRIKVVHKENGGLSDARNAGLDAATGKYIYFLDGDDTIEPHLLSTVIPLMNDGLDMVIFNYYCTHENEERKPVQYHRLGSFLLDELNRPNFIIQEILGDKVGWQAWNRIYSRDLIEKYHLRFADNRKIFAEDLYFCLCYCAHATRILSIADCLYNYLQRESSIMGVDGKRLNVGRMNELSKAVYSYWEQLENCQKLLDVFPLAHYSIISHVLESAVEANKRPLTEFREVVRDDIVDWDFFARHLQLSHLQKRILFRRDSYLRAKRNLSFLKYLFGGSLAFVKITEYYLSIVKFFARLMSFSKRVFRGVYKRSLCFFGNKELKKRYCELRKYKKRVFFLGTEEYGNIGDHQINESIRAFLSEVLPSHVIHEVTSAEIERHLPFLKKNIRDEDLLVFPGGGNFGDAYYAAQWVREMSAELWPRNRKIIFPQTIYFSNRLEGRKGLKRAKQLFTDKTNTELFAREQKSYTFAQENFSCNSYFVPDIVLYSNLQEDVERENYVLFCLRNDIEKVLSENVAQKMEQACIDAEMPVKKNDLQLDYHVKKENRVIEIEKKLACWRKARLVITDRLHGMIFAAVTGTPCIAFSNYNYKVKGSYEWIKYLPYVKYAETAEEAISYIPELLSMRNCQYNNAPLQPYYDKLAEIVRR